MIIYTCPKCGHDLHDLVLASNPPVSKKECWNCGWSWTGESEEVIRIPFGGNSLNMRDATLEERENVRESIEKIAQSTPINFWTYHEEPSPCDGCSNNPKNGGNGICWCTLGQRYTITC